VAYLVLARFSGRLNDVTSASTHAVETYTGIGRMRAKEAIAALIKAGLISRDKEGTRPLYSLRGRPDKRAEFIFLPNELVTGAAGEESPVERVRQCQDPMTLRLFVDLYREQWLVDCGGVNRRYLWRQYDRVKVGERGPYVVWGFGTPKTWIHWGGPIEPHYRPVTKDEEKQGHDEAVDASKRLSHLEALGLLRWVPHLFDSDKPEAEPIHAVGCGTGETIENALGMKAQTVARHMVTPGQFNLACGTLRGSPILIPVLRHRTEVALIGIARLRYRPKTKMTAAWWARTHETAEKWGEVYDQMAP
jgi:hypothetical protein